MTSEGCGERRRRAVTHVPQDVALPYLTTEISRVGITNEYRTETAEGYPTPDEGENWLRPSPSRISSVQDRFARCDQERGLREKTLVTWEKTDPEDPWKWFKTARWYISAVVASAVIQVTMSTATVTGEFGVRHGSVVFLQRTSP